MSRKSVSVQSLANEASVDVDEVLVTSWDLGIDHVMNAESMISHGDARHLRVSLGVATRANLRSQVYWENLLGLSALELRNFLSDQGVTMSERASKIPPGGVSRLKAEARGRGVDPLKGNTEIAPLKFPVGPGRAFTEERQEPSDDDIESRFTWRSIGHERPLRFLSTQEVTDIHFALVRDFQNSDDPISPPGIKSEDLLNSAIFRPQTTFGETPKYPTVETGRPLAVRHRLWR